MALGWTGIEGSLGSNIEEASVLVNNTIEGPAFMLMRTLE